MEQRYAPDETLAVIEVCEMRREDAYDIGGAVQFHDANIVQGVVEGAVLRAMTTDFGSHAGIIVLWR